MSVRVWRGVKRAVTVGAVAAFITVLPMLFMQSFFSGESVRCENARERNLPTADFVGCEDNIDVQWLPFLVFGGGTAFGVVGGFAYGFFESRAQYDQWKGTRERWLPF